MIPPSLRGFSFVFSWLRFFCTGKVVLFISVLVSVPLPNRAIDSSEKEGRGGERKGVAYAVKEVQNKEKEGRGKELETRCTGSSRGGGLGTKDNPDLC